MTFKSNTVRHASYQSQGRIFLVRDGFRERGTLGHLSFWISTQVWSIWPFVWKAWQYAPLMCRVPLKNLSFVVPTLVLRLPQIFNRKLSLSYILLWDKWQCDIFLEFIVLSCSWEVLFVKFPWFLAFFVSLFFGYIHFHAGPCCCPQKYPLVVDLMSCT